MDKFFVEAQWPALTRKDEAIGPRVQSPGLRFVVGPVASTLIQVEWIPRIEVKSADQEDDSLQRSIESTPHKLLRAVGSI